MSTVTTPPDHSLDHAPASSGAPADGVDESMPGLNLQKVRQIKLKDYAIRFLFGGIVSVIAALVGQWTTPRIGGIFTAFPAILLASLTLIGKEDGQERAAQDAQGGVAGSIALVFTAVFLALTLDRIAGVASLLGALVYWTILAVALYALGVKLGWLRTRKGDGQRPPHEK